MRTFRFRHVSALTFVFLTTSAFSCFLLEPQDPRAGMEGTWFLTEVDGKPIPPGGYSIEVSTPLGPAPTGYVLKSGSLAFAEPMQGKVVAAYVMEKDGLISPEDFYSGTFVYDGASKVTLKSVKDQLDGTVTFGASSAGVITRSGDLEIDQIVRVKNPITGGKINVRLHVQLRRPSLIG